MPRCELNSLSQSLMALPAPSGREPLAKPVTLRLNKKVCRSTPSVTACTVPAPQGDAFELYRKLCRHH